MEAFFYVRFKHVISQSYEGKTTSNIFSQHEQEKKREYNEGILEVEHGSFTPAHFCNLMAAGAFIILNSKIRDILCVRGSQTPFHIKDVEIGEDFRPNNIERLSCGRAVKASFL